MRRALVGFAAGVAATVLAVAAQIVMWAVHADFYDDDDPLREQIAADIEAERDHFAERTGTPREHPLCRAYDDAARIARGDS